MSAAVDGYSNRVSIHLLGTFQVVVGDRAIDARAWKLKRATHLVKLLALARGHQLHRDQLIDQLWPDADGDWALGSFHQALHAARHALEPYRAARTSRTILPLRQQVLALVPEGDLWIDVEAFQEAAAEARSSGDPRRCLDALALYTGDLLPEDLYEDWTQPARVSLRATYITLLSTTAQIQEAREALGDAIATLQTLLAEDPLSEPAYASLLRLHALTGRRDQAARVYQQLQETLRRELDAEPSDEINELYGRINSGEIAARERSTPPLVAPSPGTTSSVAPPSQVAQISLRQHARESRLIGRQPEIELLQGAFDSVLSGHGQVVFLSGEPGIGKTRLSEALADYAESQGAGVLWARCHRADDTPAFWLWSQIVRASLRGASIDQLRADLGGGLSAMAQVVPALHDLIPDVPVLAPLEGSQARYRFFASLADYLDRLAARRPLVLLLDDLQWADPSSVLALEHVADQLASQRILLVGTYRSAEVEGNLAVAQALARLSRSQATKRIPLEGFTLDDTTALAEAVSGNALPPAISASIQDRTDGNPFFVRELVRLMREEGWDELPEVPGRWGSAVPVGVREAVILRLQPLARETQSILTAAAVIGSSFDLDVLASVSEVAFDPLLDRLEEAVNAGLVEADLENVNQFWFSHVLIREALLAGLLGVRQARLHARIGEVLEKRATTQADPTYSEIAYHYAEAAPIGKAEQAITYLTLAGKQSMERFAYAESAEQYQHAAQLLEGFLPDRQAELADTLLRLGKAKWAAAEPEAARANLLRAYDVARTMHDVERTALAALELAYHAGAFTTGEQQLLRETYAEFPLADNPLRVMLMSQIVIGASTKQMTFAEETEGLDAFSMADEALAMARRIGDPSAVAEALLSKIHMTNVEDIDTQLALATELLTLSVENHILQNELMARSMRAGALLWAGRIAEVDQEIAAYSAIAKQHRLPLRRWSSTVKNAMRAFMRGDLEATENLMELALRIGQGINSGSCDVVYLQQMFFLKREQNRLAEVEVPLRNMAATQPSFPFWRILFALLAVDTARYHEASKAVDDIMASGLAAIPPGIYRLGSLALLAEVAAKLRDRACSKLLIDALQPFNRLFISTGNDSVFLGPVTHYLGLLAETLGRPSDAAAYFKKALKQELATDTPILRFRTLYAYANQLLSQNKDSEEARPLIEEAAEIGQQLALPRAVHLLGGPQNSLSACHSP